MNEIERLRSDKNYLGVIYKEHKDYCVNFMRKMYRNDEVIKDIYQDAVIVLYEKSLNKEFELTCTVKTFLGSICRYQVLNRFKTEAKDADDFEFNELESSKDWLEEEELESDQKLTAMEKALNKLKESTKNCYELIKRYFYKQQSMKEIAVEMGFSNDKSAKNQKAKCQKKLREYSNEYLG